MGGGGRRVILGPLGRSKLKFIVGEAHNLLSLHGAFRSQQVKSQSAAAGIAAAAADGREPCR